MKSLLIGLMLTTSLLSMADTSVTFVSTETGHSEVIGFAGCTEAKNKAIEAATMNCLQSGFNNCDVIATRKLSSKIAKAYLKVCNEGGCFPGVVNGYCEYEALVKGTM